MENSSHSLTGRPSVVSAQSVSQIDVIEIIVLDGMGSSFVRFFPISEFVGRCVRGCAATATPNTEQRQQTQRSVLTRIKQNTPLVHYDVTTTLHWKGPADNHTNKSLGIRPPPSSLAQSHFH